MGGARGSLAGRVFRWRFRRALRSQLEKNPSNCFNICDISEALFRRRGHFSKPEQIMDRIHRCGTKINSAGHVEARAVTCAPSSGSLVDFQTNFV